MDDMRTFVLLVVVVVDGVIDGGRVNKCYTKKRITCNM